MAAAEHRHTIQTSQSSSAQPASDGRYLALPTAKNGFEIWDLDELGISKPMSVEVHRRPVSSLAFSRSSHPTLVCSAAEDYIILWNVNKIRAANRTGQPPRGQILTESLGKVQYLTFSPDDLFVAACVGKEAFIVDLKQHRLAACLQGHNGPITCAEFCLDNSSNIITASEDRTFKIWDIQSSSLIYQSTIISSSPFISLAMNPLQAEFCLGTSDGQVRVYDATEGGCVRCVRQCDVSRLVAKATTAPPGGGGGHDPSAPSWLSGPVVISSRSSRLHPASPPSTDPPGATSEPGSAVLALSYASPQGASRGGTPLPPKLSFLQQDDAILKELLQLPALLLIGTTSCLLQLNAQTLELQRSLSFYDSIPSSSLLEAGHVQLSLAEGITFAETETNTKKCCIIRSLLTNEVNVIDVTAVASVVRESSAESLNRVRGEVTTHASLDASSLESSEASMSDDVTLSVLSSGPLVEGSPLRSTDLVLKTKNPDPGKKRLRAQVIGSLGSTGRIVDHQPLTVHQKISSSQYAMPTSRKMFQPNTKATRRRQPLSPLKPRPPRWQYSEDGPMPTRLDLRVDVADRPTAINRVTFSEDGSRLLCALTNTTAQVFRMPPAQRGATFSGHKGSVTSVNWSHDGQWFVTSSDDHSACVWSENLPDPLMTFTNVKHNFNCDAERSRKNQVVFDRAVRFVQFYCVDRFILLTSANKFYLYKYHLDPSKSDIQRYLNNNRYKLVKSWQMKQANQITAFSAINGFHSYIALACGSDKSLEVFDLNVGCSVRTLPDVHTRVVHTIAQNKGSPYASQPGSAYDLFVTAATSDCIKLWDLRSNRCVRRYEGHLNKIHPCGVTISPCSRFIATGSEDRSAYIYDIRSGTYLHKLTGHTDTVADVAFNPLLPQLVTATTDGKIRLFVTP